MRTKTMRIEIADTRDLSPLLSVDVTAGAGVKSGELVHDAFNAVLAVFTLAVMVGPLFA